MNSYGGRGRGYPQTRPVPNNSSYVHPQPVAAVEVVRECTQDDPVDGEGLVLAPDRQVGVAAGFEDPPEGFQDQRLVVRPRHHGGQGGPGGLVGEAGHLGHGGGDDDVSWMEDGDVVCHDLQVPEVFQN